MKIAKKPLSVAQARKALDRAKARGRVDEIRQASGRLAGAVSSERASVRRAPAELAQAVVDQRQAIEQAPATLTPAQRGAQTRKLRRLEAAERDAVKAAEDLAAQLNPAMAVLTEAWRRLQPGRSCFGNAYTIIDPCSYVLDTDEKVFWYGCDVIASTETGALAADYRWTGRTLSASDAAGDLRALRDSYKRPSGPGPTPKVQTPCEQWLESQESSLELAKKGLGFELLVVVVRQ